MTLVGPEQAVFVKREGVYRVGNTGDATVLYPPESVFWSQGCASEDLAGASSGLFLYAPGCNVYPLFRGHADGSGVSLLYYAGNMAPNPVGAENYLCMTRDPAGGFYFIVRTMSNGVDLFHLDANATATSGYRRIFTNPSFTLQAGMDWDDPFAFSYCTLAAPDDGSVVFLTFSQLWRVQ
jgi:hypothetical protein